VWGVGDNGITVVTLKRVTKKQLAVRHVQTL
jgi:hypothetical protein